MNARDARDIIIALVVVLFIIFMLLGCANGTTVPPIPHLDAVASLNAALAQCGFYGIELRC